MAALLPVGLDRAARRVRQPPAGQIKSGADGLIIAPPQRAEFYAPNALTVKAFPAGNSFVHDGAAAYCYGLPIPFSVAEGVTLFGQFVLDIAASGTGLTPVSLGRHDGVSRYDNIRIEKSSFAHWGNLWGIRVSDQTTDVVVSTGDSGVENRGVVFTVVATISATGALAIYDSTGRSGSTTGATTAVLAAVTHLDVGGSWFRNSYESGWWTGGVFLAGVLPRVRNAAECFDIVRRPWQFLKTDMTPRLISLPIGPFTYARPIADNAAGLWTPS